MVTNDNRAKALAQHLDLTDTDYILEVGNNEYRYGDNYYLILTNKEADEIWDDFLRGYLDECVLAKIPNDLQCYFNEDKWLEDARKDGRGHAIASYDGVENFEEVDDTIYYIYRMG